MKAEFNGMKLEGTPKEIFEFMELRMKTEKAKINVDDWFKKKPTNPYNYHPNILPCVTAKWEVDPNLFTKIMI